MYYLQPKKIIHRGKPEKYEQMILDCARNVKLNKRATKLLMCYAGYNNGYKPVLSEIEKETGIASNLISAVRKELINHGLIGYGEEFGNMLVIDWNRIRAFAMLEQPLVYEKKNSEKYFSPVKENGWVSKEKRASKKSLLERGKRFKIPGVDEKKDVFLQFYGNMTEQEYVDFVRAFPEYGRNKQRCLMSDAEYAKHIDIKAFRPNAYQEHTYTKEEQEQYEKNLAFMKAALHILPF